MSKLSIKDLVFGIPKLKTAKKMPTKRYSNLVYSVFLIEMNCLCCHDLKNCSKNYKKLISQR